MTTYVATFDSGRIGRTHDVPPLTIEVPTPDAGDVAEKVYRFARPKLASRDMQVDVDLDKMRGWISCGFHNGGTFTLAEVAP